MTDSGPTLLTRAMVMGALKDETFFKRMPEFTTLKPKLEVMTKHVGGCKGCRGRHDPVARNVTADFMAIVSVLNEEAVMRLKRFLGVSKLMYSAHDPRTGAYRTRVV